MIARPGGDRFRSTAVLLVPWIHVGQEGRTEAYAANTTSVYHIEFLNMKSTLVVERRVELARCIAAHIVRVVLESKNGLH